MGSGPRPPGVNSLAVRTVTWGGKKPHPVPQALRHGVGKLFMDHLKFRVGQKWRQAWALAPRPLTGALQPPFCNGPAGAILWRPRVRRCDGGAGAWGASGLLRVLREGIKRALQLRGRFRFFCLDFTKRAEIAERWVPVGQRWAEGRWRVFLTAPDLWEEAVATGWVLAIAASKTHG